MSAASFRLAFIKGIRAERTRQGMTQQELADRMGWSRKIVNQIEMGDRAVAIHEVPDLCRALRVNLARLVVDADPTDRDALGL